MKFHKKITILLIIVLTLFGCKKKEVIQNEIVYDNNSIENGDYKENNIENNELFDNMSDLRPSYILNPGTFYIYIDILMDNLRSTPDINGEIVDVTPSIYMYDAQIVQIIEYTGIEERKDNIIYNWYKVYLEYSNNMEGYLRIETFVYDIDNNGIDDYFYIRYLPTNYYLHSFQIKYDEIYIIINNERISYDTFLKTFLNYHRESITTYYDDYNKLNEWITANVWVQGVFKENQGNVILVIDIYEAGSAAPSPYISNALISEINSEGVVSLKESKL